MSEIEIDSLVNIVLAKKDAIDDDNDDHVLDFFTLRKKLSTIL